MTYQRNGHCHLESTLSALPVIPVVCVPALSIGETCDLTTLIICDMGNGALVIALNAAIFVGVILISVPALASEAKSSVSSIEMVQ